MTTSTFSCPAPRSGSGTPFSTRSAPWLRSGFDNLATDRRYSLARPFLRKKRRSAGYVAEAVVRFSARPISRASRPASTALRKACAIRTGSDAIAIAVFTRTASAPISKRLGRLAWRAEAGVDDDRHGRLFDDDFDLRARFDAAVAADRRTERHHGRGAHILQTLRQNRVGIDVWQHGEAFLHEDLRRGERFNRVGQEISRVRMNLRV